MQKVYPAELEETATVANYATVQNEGQRNVERMVTYYNLDVIISVGYRVRSLRGTQFRIWATERLREYLIKGFTMNDDLLKKAGAGNYWKELLERIRDIRSSEKGAIRESVQARMKMTIKRLLKKYGYPPDKTAKAVDIVMEQTKLMCQNESV